MPIGAINSKIEFSFAVPSTVVGIGEGDGDGLVTTGLGVIDGSGLGDNTVVGESEGVILGTGVGLASTVVVGVGEGLSTTGLVEGLEVGSGEIVAVAESEVTEGEGTGSGD